MNTRIKYFSYLIIILSVSLMLAFLLTNLPKSDPLPPPSQFRQTPNGSFFRDSLLRLRKETDSLKETITGLSRRNEKIRTQWLVQKKQLLLKIRQINTLSPDSQILFFKTKTATPGRTVDTITRIRQSGITVSSSAYASRSSSAASPDSVSDSTLVSIPLYHIRNANEKFLRLETSDSLNEMLETIIANQDSLLLTCQEAVQCSETQNSLLDLQTETLQQALLQKNGELKDLKTKHRIELTGAGLLLLLAILF